MGVFDPALGAMSDGWRSRWGRRLPVPDGGIDPVGALLHRHLPPFRAMLHGAALFPPPCSACRSCCGCRSRLSICRIRRWGRRSATDTWSGLASPPGAWGDRHDGALALRRHGVRRPSSPRPQGLMHASALLALRRGLDRDHHRRRRSFDEVAIHALRDRAHARARHWSFAGPISDATSKKCSAIRPFRVLFASAIFFFAGFALNQAG